MLANSKGHDLVEHLKAVAHLSKQMALRLGMSQELVEVVYVAGLLHDIGKAINSFQDYMQSCVSASQLLIVDEDFVDPIKGYPLHHEIGWAYLTTKMGHIGILNAVYWHHARPIHDLKVRVFSDADMILEQLKPADIKALDSLYQDLTIDPKFTGNLIYGTAEVPDLFYKDGSCNANHNAEFMLIRACVISADRYISALPAHSLKRYADGDDLSDVIDAMLAGHVGGALNCPSGYDPSRYNLQGDIVTAVGDERTSIVKAPAGLGKTMIGILWSKLRQGKVIWVCPRNVVADSVYENIISEINVLGLDCTVELYRTGSRQKTNREDGRPDFDSDIIVTNIDAVMSPMVNNRIAGRLFTVYGAHIVLDEFHEFVSEAPLFAAFVTYMRARHRVASNCKTLLLSATPSLVQVLWDTDDRKTLILPDEQKHYPPQHSGVYSVDFTVGFPVSATSGSLLVCNSVKEAQDNYAVGGYTQVIHHRYTETDRSKREDHIRLSFGKNKTGVYDGESLSAALVVQAAMDISFIALHDSVCSPESTLQRVGRVDRWGTFQKDHPSINFIDMSSEKTEGGAIRTVYDAKLQAKWYAFLKQSLTGVSMVDLKQLYCIYNDFYQVYRLDIMLYIKEQYRVGMNGFQKGMEFLGLVGFNPVKVLNADPDKKKKQPTKNLRSPDGSYFYTVELVGQPNVWLPPQDVLSEGYEIYKRYKDDKTGKLILGLFDLGSMLTRIKGLVACGYVAWTRISKGKQKLPSGLDDWFRKARDPETPLPDFSRKYDPDLGVIKNTI